MMMEQLTVTAVVNVVHDFLSFHKHMTQLKKYAVSIGYSCQTGRDSCVLLGIATEVTSQLQFIAPHASFPPSLEAPAGTEWTNVPGDEDERVCGQLLNGLPGFRTCTRTRSLWLHFDERWPRIQGSLLDSQRRALPGFRIDVVSHLEPKENGIRGVRGAMWNVAYQANLIPFINGILENF